MKWIDGGRMRRIEALGLSKTELAALDGAFESLAPSASTKVGGDPVLACRDAPMLQCDMVQKLIAQSLRMGGLGAQDSAMAMCRALDELCGLSLDGGWIREEDSHWADRDPAAHALYNDMPKLALMLVDRGASIEAQLHDGEPLLIWFARSAGSLLQDFLDRVPDLNARGREGGTFLHHLSMLDKFDGEQPLGLYRRVIAKAKGRGMDLNVRDHEGRAPLHWAAHMGDLALSQGLIEAGADPLALSSRGSTPWEEAGSQSVADYLESAALAARESMELGEMGREKTYLAGAAALDLIAKGLLQINGRAVRDLSDLLDIKAKSAGKGLLSKESGRKRL